MRQLLTLVQINDYPQIYKVWLIRILKILVSLLCFYFILTEISIHEVFDDLETFSLAVGWTGGGVVLLMFINWLLEAEKWRISIPQENISLPESLRLVLGGLALNWVLPFTSGDALQRVISLKNRKEGGYALLVNRVVMLLITSIYGGLSVLYYFDQLSPLYLLVFIAICIGIGALYLGSQKVRALSSQFMGIPLGRVMILSMLRYFVFTFQFYLLINLYNPDLSLTYTFFGIGWIFFFRSFVPSLFGNFGVREASALVFFSGLIADPNLILFPCLVIWLINTVIPSFLGSLQFFKLNLNIAQ